LADRLDSQDLSGQAQPELVGVRILYVIQPRDGGSVVHLTHLVRWAAGIGMDVGVVCDPGIESLEELRRSAQVFPVRMDRWPGPSDLQALVHLYRVMHRFRPALLHLHCAKAGALGRIVTMVSPGVRVIYSPHHPAYRNPELPVPARWIFRLAEMVLARRTLALVAVSSDVERDLRSLGGTRVFLTTNGVPLHMVETAIARGQPRSAGGALTVGCLGVLTRRKGVDVLVRAAGLLSPVLPTLRVQIGGDGPERTRLCRLVEELGIGKHVEFVGHVSDAYQFLKALDIVALPSRLEAQSIVALEAMALGKPVVASAVYGLRTVVRDGVDGVLVRPESPEGLATAILRLARDPELREMLGRAAAAKVRERHTIDHMLADHARIYRWALERRNTHGCAETDWSAATRARRRAFD
jgi:glycosyltransferase involved in cell wall biosynthesis